jgi:hypothetical protein
MTVMASNTARSASGPQELSGSLGPALSASTNDIVRRVAALRNRPSPASLRIEAAAATNSKPLQESLFDALAGVKILTSRVAMHLERDWRDRLFRQLDSLHDPDEWETGDQPIQQSSFATFLKAILSINPDRRPSLGLSHGGHLIGAWTRGQDRLTIEFLANDRVRWVLSLYHGDDDIGRYAGEDLVSRLAEGLAAYQPERWFSHGHDHQPT